MFSKRVWACVMPVAAMLATLAVAGPASAATGSLGCRASVARVSLLNGAVPAVEPYVANPSTDPCSADAAGVSTGDLLNLGGLNLGGALGSLAGQPAGDIALGPVSADTNAVSTSSQLSASSLASVSGVSIPTPAGAISIVGPAQATASYECVNGAIQSVAGSTLSALQIGGNTIQLPPNGGQDTIPLTLPSADPGVLPATDIGSIAVNHSSVTANSVTEQLLNVTINDVATVVVGEASVDRPATDPCSGLSSPGGPGGNPGGGNTGPSGPGGDNGGNGAGGSNGTGGGNGVNGSNGTTTASSICPVGSTLVAATGLCEIVPSSGSAANAITVGSPNSGDIVGGNVITLAAAKARFKSICLRGPGPKYVVVGTNAANRIVVKKVRMRVLALGGKDSVTVKSGNNTCVDGGTGNDTILNKGKNRVTVYGGNGNDKVTIGNGKAYVSGGNGRDVLKAGNGKVTLLGNNGNDRITAGNGNDQLNGDAGNDIITAGTGVDRINGGPGINKMTARGRKAYLKGSGGHSVGYLKKSNKNKKFARTHGVKLKRLA